VRQGRPAPPRVRWHPGTCASCCARGGLATSSAWSASCGPGFASSGGKGSNTAAARAPPWAPAGAGGQVASESADF
jgi:hypothetical protein